MAIAVAVVGLPSILNAPPNGARPGRFDNGTFSFDYPITWHVLHSDEYETALGDGMWTPVCPENWPSGQASACPDSTIDISGGTIVLRVSLDSGAPNFCTTPAEFGPGDIEKYVEDSLHATQPTTRWQIRRPGYQFGMSGNVWIEAISSNPEEVAAAQRAVDSFRWDAELPCQSILPGQSVPGTAGHYDNGQFSFDYPKTWRVLSGELDEGMADHVFAVLGTGVWHSGCRILDNGGECTGDVVDVSGGRVVVKIYLQGGLAPVCQSATPNASLGPNVLLRTTSGDTTTWEIMRPGVHAFTGSGDMYVEAWANDATTMAQAEALIASFRWSSSTETGDQNCFPMESPSA